jgi:putative Mg2+ transporter-C (MgtC) family protein
MARVFYGLMTGIGFIGGGAILKNGGSVHGTATAASLWTTGAMGGAVAFGRYEIAALLTLIVWLTFRYAPAVKPKAQSQTTDGKEQEHA